MKLLSKLFLLLIFGLVDIAVNADNPTERMTPRMALENTKRELANNSLLPFDVLKERQPLVSADLVMLMWDYEAKIENVINLHIPEQRDSAINQLISLREAFLQQKDLIQQWQKLHKEDPTDPQLETIEQQVANSILLPIPHLGVMMKRTASGPDFDKLTLKYLNALNELIMQLKDGNDTSKILSNIMALKEAYEKQEELLGQYWNLKG